MSKVTLLESNYEESVESCRFLLQGKKKKFLLKITILYRLIHSTKYIYWGI